MGRIAGVTVEQTRERLLQAAATVFANFGYERAGVTDVAREAGLSSGAIYAHFGSKAELFAAAIREHSDHEFVRLLGEGSMVDVAGVIAARGRTLDRRDPAEGSLLVEAIVAAKHDPQVAGLLASSFREREGILTQLLTAAQAAGEIDDTVSPGAAARFMLMLALGSLLVSAVDVESPDHDEWTHFITSLVDRFRPPEPQERPA